MKTKVSELFERIRRTLKSEEYRNEARMERNQFTRKRKVGFVMVVAIIMNMIRRSTQIELDDFREVFMTEQSQNTTYTKQSFSEARQKLSPAAFTLLNDEFVKGFYEDNYKTYKGFVLLAGDGSVIEIPNTPETREHYGSIESSEGSRMARARYSHLYDVLNQISVAPLLARVDASERDLLKNNIEALQALTLPNTPILLLLDRGYPSADLILYLMSRGIRFVMRASSQFFTEVKEARSDAVVEIEMTKERRKALRKRGIRIPRGTVISLRVIKVELASGLIETLVTDLTIEEVAHDEFKQLYHMRWSIETGIDIAKNKFEIQNISGQKPIIIDQDFYATVLLSNIASVIKQAAQEELESSASLKNRKYAEYKINNNILVGKLKNRLVMVILEEDDDKRDNMYNRLISDIRRYVVPVRPGRTAPRRKLYTANKYAQSKRRCL